MSAVAQDAPPPWIWIEGEDYAWTDATVGAEARDLPGRSWYTDVKKTTLSGQNLLAHYSEERGARAEYAFTAPAAGEYEFWLRGNPLRTSVTYQFDGAGETFRLVTHPCFEPMNIAANDSPDMRHIAWFKGPRHTLAAGDHALTVWLDRADEGLPHHGSIDCILLTPEPFMPDGPARPGETINLAAPGTWAFSAPYDPDTPEALFDLRDLQEKTAGQNGWVTANAEGGFVRGDGTPVRFWACNPTVGLARGQQHAQSMEEIEENAKHLAKRGINLARLTMQKPYASPDDFSVLDEATLNGFLRTMSVMKRHGIYTLFAPYWSASNVPGAGYKPFGRETGSLTGLLFWEPELQGRYKEWLREIFTRPNPYHPENKPLKDDPALAILLLQSEDSLLFWSQWGVMANHREEFAALNALFLAWLKDNGLEVEADPAFAGWLREQGYPEDTKLDFRFWVVHHQDAEAPATFRLSMRFCAETMRAFNEEIKRFVREDLGCPVLICSGNWVTAYPARLLDLERWSYDATEVMSITRYVTGDHLPADPANDRTGWMIGPGDRYADASCVRDNWRGLPVAVKQVSGKPFLIPESTWVPPLRSRAESPFLLSCYMSLSGVDGYAWFQVNNTRFDPYLNKWQAADPEIMAGWPAAAWMYHKGYIRRGRPAVSEKRALEGDMWDIRCPVIAEDTGYDPNRPGTALAQHNIAGGAPYGAYFTGPVVVEYGADPAETVIDLDGQDPADLERGVVRSNTGELFLNAPEGYCLLDAPCAQGVAGFLKGAGGIFRTQALEFQSDNEYAVLLAVSLDGEPLAESGKILVQATTRCRPYGYTEEPAPLDEGEDAKQGFRILDAGSLPWNVEWTRAALRLSNPRIGKATLCDANFYPAAPVPCLREGGALVVPLPRNAMYVVLEGTP